MALAAADEEGEADEEDEDDRRGGEHTGSWRGDATPPPAKSCTFSWCCSWYWDVLVPMPKPPPPPPLPPPPVATFPWDDRPPELTCSPPPPNIDPLPNDPYVDTEDILEREAASQAAAAVSSSTAPAPAKISSGNGMAGKPSSLTLCLW